MPRSPKKAAPKAKGGKPDTKALRDDWRGYVLAEAEPDFTIRYSRKNGRFRIDGHSVARALLIDDESGETADCLVLRKG